MEYAAKYADVGSYLVYDLAAVADSGIIFDMFAQEWERGRFSSFNNIIVADNYRKSRGAVRRILAGVLGILPQNLQLPAPPAYGAAHGICFSVSRSGPDAVLAVSVDGKIGIDLVNIAPDSPPLDSIIVSAADRAAVACCYAVVRHDLCGWAAKEAAAKLFNAPHLPPEAWTLRAQGRELLATDGRQTARIAILPMAGPLIAAIAQQTR